MKGTNLAEIYKLGKEEAVVKYSNLRLNIAIDKTEAYITDFMDGFLIGMIETAQRFVKNADTEEIRSMIVKAAEESIGIEYSDIEKLDAIAAESDADDDHEVLAEYLKITQQYESIDAMMKELRRQTMTENAAKWKTVQEYLKEFDKNKLSSMYLHRLTVHHDDIALQDKTLGEMNKKVHGKINEFIDRMRTIEIKEPENGGKGILYAYKCIGEDFFADVAFDLMMLDEFAADPYNAQHYAFELTDQAEIAGFLIAETSLTKNHLDELLVEALFTASAFGFGPEGREEVLASLNESIKHIDDAVPAEEAWQKMSEEYGIEFIEDDEDPDEGYYYRAALRAREDFENNSRRNARNIIYRMLHFT